MKTCSNCGKEIELAAKFCTNCGTPADGASEPAAAEGTLHRHQDASDPSNTERVPARSDPGATIRMVGLFLCVALFVGCILAGVGGSVSTAEGTRQIEHAWSEVSRGEGTRLIEAGIRAKAFSQFLGAVAGSLLLPVLSFAAWTTSKFRCQQAKRALRVEPGTMPVRFSASDLLGSVKGWATWWNVSAFLSVAGMIVALWNALYPEAFSTSTDGGESIAEFGKALANGIKSGFWEATVSQKCMVIGCMSVVAVLSFIWAACLKNRAEEAEELARELRIHARGDIGKWKSKQIQSIVAGMVPIPGKPFLVGKFQTTQAQWEAVTGKTPSECEGDDLPVENVSWDDCQEFLKKLNEIPAVKESRIVFRLPTAEEWEFACRAGATGDYCRLSDGTEITANTLGEVAWYADNTGSSEEPHPVGRKKPNAFGLFDMFGNVFEWTLSSEGENRINLGGSLFSSAENCKASKRRLSLPSVRSPAIGFRLFAPAIHFPADHAAAAGAGTGPAEAGAGEGRAETPGVALALSESGRDGGTAGREDESQLSAATVVKADNRRTGFRFAGCLVALAGSLVMALTVDTADPRAFLAWFCFLASGGGALWFFLRLGEMPGMVLDPAGISLGNVRIPWTDVAGFQKETVAMSPRLLVFLKSPATFAGKLGSGTPGWGMGRPFRFSGGRISVDSALLEIEFDKLVEIFGRYFAEYGNREPAREDAPVAKKLEPHRIKERFATHGETADAGAKEITGDRATKTDGAEAGKTAD